MPPEGYQTVTLPAELVQALDAVGDGGPTNGVRELLDDYDADKETVDAWIVGMNASERRKIAEEVAELLR